MPTFEVRQIEVPLFGVVEAPNQAPWLNAFPAATATTRVQVDAAALDTIASDLELDAEGLAADAERYVNGSYRAKARGMGRSRLGDLGEILTFLVNRMPGQEIVRVVSWNAGIGQAIKGSRFPQPDFPWSGPPTRQCQQFLRKPARRVGATGVPNQRGVGRELACQVGATSACEYTQAPRPDRAQRTRRYRAQ